MSLLYVGNFFFKNNFKKNLIIVICIIFVFVKKFIINWIILNGICFRGIKELLLFGFDFDIILFRLYIVLVLLRF